MTKKAKATKADKSHGDEARDRGKKDRSAALWLGDEQKELEMGWGRGPSKLKGHELLSWFFSRDGI